jgi:hypothetical protein
MSETNLMDAFARYKVKCAPRARSALAPDRAVVLSCFYTRFHRAGSGALEYEEDLASDNSPVAKLLRAHLAEALTDELDVKVIIAMTTGRARSLDTAAAAPVRPSRMTFHARTDLIGRVTFFDGSRFIVQFRKADIAT